MPWGAIYYLDVAYDVQCIRRHELVHIAQMRREGVIKWLVKYFWQIHQVGYQNNSYEIEARRISNTNGPKPLMEVALRVLDKYEGDDVARMTKIETNMLQYYLSVIHA